MIARSEERSDVVISILPVTLKLTKASRIYKKAKKQKSKKAIYAELRNSL